MPILETQAFALPLPHRIDNAEKPTPVRIAKNNRYISVPRRRFGCHLPVVEVEVAKFVSHNDRRSACADFPHDSANRASTLAFAARKVLLAQTFLTTQPIVQARWLSLLGKFENVFLIYMSATKQPASLCKPADVHGARPSGKRRCKSTKKSGNGQTFYHFFWPFSEIVVNLHRTYRT